VGCTPTQTTGLQSRGAPSSNMPNQSMRTPTNPHTIPSRPKATRNGGKKALARRQTGSDTPLKP
jgi:hypothetical protein